MPVAPPDACPNCGEPFAAPRPRYCPACGQESNVRAPTLREFAQQFGGSYIAAEGALWRTLKLLLRPGALTLEYLAGRRRRYVLPLRLYLTVSLLTLVLLRSVAHFDVPEDGIVRGDGAEKPTFDVRIGGGTAGFKDGVFFCRDVPDWICKRLQRRIDFDPKAASRELSAWGDRLFANLGAAMFVLLPWFAVWLRIVYANRRLRFTEHLVFALHVHAFWFAMLALALLPVPFIGIVAFFAVPVYTWLALRRVHGGRRRWLLARTLLVSTAYGTMLVVVLAALALWTLLF